MKRNRVFLLNGILMFNVIISLFLTSCKDLNTTITITTDSEKVKSASFRGKEGLWERSNRVFRGKNGLIKYTPSLTSNNLYITKISDVYGTFYFYLEENEKLSLAVKNNTLSIIGDSRAATQNRLIKDVYLIRKVIDKYISSLKQFERLKGTKKEVDKPTEVNLDKLYKNIKHLVQNFTLNNSNYSEKFLNYIMFDCKYYKIKNELNMPRYRLKTYHEFSKNEILILEQCLKDSNIEETLLSLSYRQVLLAYIDYLRIHDPKNILIDGEDWLLNEVLVANYIPNSAVRENVVANNLMRNLYYNAKRVEYLDMVKEHAGKWSSFILELAAAQKPKKGRKVYDSPSEYPILSGDGVDGRKVSLSDFKGQWVYIDIWATWCGPCNFEIPYLNQLKYRLKEYNVAFVGVSVDKEEDREKLLKMISQKQMSGIQFHNPNIDEVYSQFGISGIPHFAIIDPEGKLYLNKAPTPSTGIPDRLLKALAGKHKK